MIEKAKSAIPHFSHTIEAALVEFLNHHQQHLPKNLHSLAVDAIEKPLLKLIMRNVDHNQSQAAKILGLNRATLRKKLIEHGMLKE